MELRQFLAGAAAFMLTATAVSLFSVSGCKAPQSCASRIDDARTHLQGAGHCTTDDQCRIVDLKQVVGNDQCLGVFQCPKAVREGAELGVWGLQARYMADEYFKECSDQDCKTAECGASEPGSEAQCNLSLGQCEIVSRTRVCEQLESTAKRHLDSAQNCSLSKECQLVDIEALVGEQHGILAFGCETAVRKDFDAPGWAQYAQNIDTRMRGCTQHQPFDCPALDPQDKVLCNPETRRCERLKHGEHCWKVDDVVANLLDKQRECWEDTDCGYVNLSEVVPNSGIRAFHCMKTVNLKNGLDSFLNQVRNFDQLFQDCHPKTMVDCPPIPKDDVVRCYKNGMGQGHCEGWHENEDFESWEDEDSSGSEEFTSSGDES